MALKGTSGNDIFFGSLFAEQIFGFGGDDFIKGSPGADTIDGGSGSDVVDYSEFFTLPFDVAGKAVDVDLERPVQFGGFAEGDVLIGIERITGSGKTTSSGVTAPPTCSSAKAATMFWRAAAAMTRCSATLR